MPCVHYFHAGTPRGLHFHIGMPHQCTNGFCQRYLDSMLFMIQNTKFKFRH
uniref:Uncharacterized protein n=1 Tax=Rhizophora mucronata TaxID=61149 RepID=A0A2P2KLE0_RHIMU